MNYETLETLQNIELHTKIIAFGIIIWVFGKAIGALSVLGTNWRRARQDLFNDLLSDAIEEADYEYVIDKCQKMLAKKPNHYDANWHLARAYYYKCDYDKANEQFQVVLDVIPRWKKSVKPYLGKIAEKLESTTD